MPRQKYWSPAINCANLCYEEKIVNAEMELDSDVDAAMDAAEMLERISPAVPVHTKDT